MQTITLKNFETKPLVNFLFGLSLRGKESRMRSRFIFLLENQILLIDKERKILIEDFSEKDIEGNPVTEIDNEGNTLAVLEDKASFNKEIASLMYEDFVIDITPENTEMIKVVQDIVLNCDNEFSGVEADMYNRFCEILEQFS